MLVWLKRIIQSQQLHWNGSVSPMVLGLISLSPWVLVYVSGGRREWGPIIFGAFAQFFLNRALFLKSPSHVQARIDSTGISDGPKKNDDVATQIFARFAEGFTKLRGYSSDTANKLLLGSRDQADIQKNIKSTNVETDRFFSIIETRIKSTDAAANIVREQSDRNRSAMIQLTDSVAALETMSTSVSSFKLSLKEMGVKLRAIDEVAKMARFIGFNASIEAARAGINGRTFAVVADEVGSLSLSIVDLSHQIQKQMEINVSEADLISDQIEGRVQESRLCIKNTQNELEDFFLNIQNVLLGVSEARQSLSEYNDLTKSVIHALEKINHVSESMLSAAANVKLIQYFAEDFVLQSKSILKHSHSEEKATGESNADSGNASEVKKEECLEKEKLGEAA